MNILTLRRLLKTFSIPLLLLLMSCSSDQTHYRDTTPKLVLEDYFNGPITAWGIVNDYNNQVTRRFCVEMTGTWQENQGLLAETFYFDDGEVSYRNWQLTKNIDGSYKGSAEDVVGEASGYADGFSFRWQYTLKLLLDDTEYEFSLDDWLYQMDEYRLFNQTDMNKFGIIVAKLTIFFDKQFPLRTCKK